MRCVYRIAWNIGGHKIWRISSPRLRWRLKMVTSLGLEPSPGCFRHRKVPSSPSRTVFSSITPSLCPVFRGIVSIDAASHTALSDDLCFLIKSLPHALVHLICLLLWGSATLEHRYFSRTILTATYSTIYYVMAGNIGGVLNLANFLKTAKPPNLNPPNISRYTVIHVLCIHVNNVLFVLRL